ncbi:MAG: hypothetical protein JO248_14720, partial [Acidimicrobiia bacterium]|nr:hypothetical protein [Acidimicrobiia bacterium]
MESTPSRIGSRAEMEVTTALIRAGKHVYLPAFAADSRVDLVYVDDEGVHRAQVKTSRLVGDVLSFRTCSNTKNVPKDYRGEVDVFAVYSPDLNEVFVVPIGDTPSRAAYLRLGAP